MLSGHAEQHSLVPTCPVVGSMVTSSGPRAPLRTTAGTPSEDRGANTHTVLCVPRRCGSEKRWSQSRFSGLDTIWEGSRDSDEL